MATKRFKNGKWRYRITRKNVMQNAIYLTFDSELEGDQAAAKIEAQLDRGIVPSAIQANGKARRELKFLKDVIAEAIASETVSKNDQKILEVIGKRHASLLVNQMNYRWAESWLMEMKRMQHLSPTTIRHHVGALARCLDHLAKHGEIPGNPLRLLAKGYSRYTQADAAALPKGQAARVDQKRDRRISEAEEISIRRVLAGEMADAGNKKLSLPYQGALELVFELALESAMRLSEIYTLERGQVDLKERTIFLEKTKNGDKRQVPMTSIAIAAYQKYLQQVLAGSRGMKGAVFAKGLLLPFWDGERSSESLNRATAKLSAQFSRIFAAAACADLHFHDLRHEATSRFFERTSLNDTEIAKITGHKSQAMLMRYANLRGSILARRLW
jgi:integrase